MSECFTPKKLENLFKKYAAEVNEELNGRFACRLKTVCGAISVRLKFYLDSGSVSGLAGYSDRIFLEAGYYHSVLSDAELVKQAAEISGIALKEDGYTTAAKQLIRALILHEYAHKMRPLEFKEIYKNPRFDDDRQRHILTAVAAIIEDVNADKLLSAHYPEDYKSSVRFMRTLLALAVRRDGSSISDTLLYEAVKLLAPDVEISAVDSDAADRLDCLFKRALSQRTLSGKLHVIEKIADLLAEEESYYISSDFKLFLAGYETHFLNSCDEYFAIGKRMVRRFTPSANGIAINRLGKLSSEDYEMLMTDGDELVPSKPYVGYAASGAESEFVSDNAEDVSEGEASEEDEDSDGAPQWSIDFNSFSTFYGYTPADVAIYKTIADINSGLIKNYARRFRELLKPNQEEREEKLLYGKGISSSRLFDVKKRYWFSGTETADPRSAFDVTILMYSVTEFDGVEDMDRIFSESCCIPNRYLIYGLVAAIEALEKVNVNTAILTGVLFGMDGIFPRMLKDPDDSDTKYQLGKLLREANYSGFNDSHYAPYLYFDLGSARRIIKSSHAERHILLYISDFDANAKKFKRDCLDSDCSESMENVRKMARQDRVAFSAFALDYNNKDDEMCYPVFSKAFPNVVQCTNREEFPRQLLSGIEKTIKSFK